MDHLKLSSLPGSSTIRRKIKRRRKEKKEGKKSGKMPRGEELAEVVL
jgi:hypothetical protein